LAAARALAAIVLPVSEASPQCRGHVHELQANLARSFAGPAGYFLAAHAGSSLAIQPVIGGLSPTALRRAIERLRSDADPDVSLAALASDAGLSRFHFCRAFKESTGLSPHTWLRQHRLEQAMNMLRDTNESVASIAATLGYSSQTAFAAAFRKLTGETPSDWRRRIR
jgi:AraC family transcriptional regulator